MASSQKTGRTRSSAQTKDLQQHDPGSPPTSPTTANLPTGKDEVTKSLMAAFSSPEFKEILDQAVSTAVRREVKTVMRESLGEEIQALIGPLEEQFQALEMEHDRRYTVTSQEIKDLKDSKRLLEDKIMILERAHRANNIKMTGVNLHIPVPPKNHDENQPKIDVQDIMKNKVMEVFEEAGIEGVAKTDMVNIQKFRLQGQPSLMIIRMNNEGIKNRVFKQRTKLRQCSTKIFMNEDLTRQDAQLFKFGRDEVKKKMLHSVWTQNGRVYAKKEENSKPFLLNKEDDCATVDV
jgi:hypothetical protein